MIFRIGNQIRFDAVKSFEIKGFVAQHLDIDFIYQFFDKKTGNEILFSLYSGDNNIFAAVRTSFGMCQMDFGNGIIGNVYDAVNVYHDKDNGYKYELSDLAKKGGKYDIIVRPYDRLNTSIDQIKNMEERYKKDSNIYGVPLDNASRFNFLISNPELFDVEANQPCTASAGLVNPNSNMGISVIDLISPKYEVEASAVEYYRSDGNRY